MVDATGQSSENAAENGRVHDRRVGNGEQDSALSDHVAASAGLTGNDVVEPVKLRTVRLRKFAYTKQLKLILLQSVRQHDAHRAQHGKMDECFSKVLDTFTSNAASSAWDTMVKPTVKTLRDKFRSMMADRKSANSMMVGQSGVTEEVGPIEQLLDDLTVEKADDDEDGRRRRQARGVREEALAAAGESIQRTAVTRRLSVGDDGRGSSRESTPKKMRTSGDLEEWNKTLINELADRRESRNKELTLREEELQLRREKWDEEKKDRELQRQQSKAQLDLLTTLASKLS